MSLRKKASIIKSFISIYRRKKLLLILCSQLLLNGGLLWLDIQLVNWYEFFYSAVQKLDQAAVFNQLVVFGFIAVGQSVAFSGIAYLGDIHEAELKKYFANVWRLQLAKLDAAAIKSSRLDQKIIDDAILAAEKLANIFPVMLYNAVKAFVFVYLLSQFTISSVFGFVWWFSINPIVLIAIIYLMIQIAILLKSNSWIERSEKFKREIEAKSRYKILESIIVPAELLRHIAGYISSIVRIRRIVAKAHSVNVFFVQLISSLTIILPFAIAYSSLVSGEMSFGILMRMCATYGSFQGACLYIFIFYRDVLKGLAAFKRLQIKSIAQ